MTKIEELKHRCVVEITMNGETDPINAMAKITLAAIEDAQRYKKIDGKWFYKLGSGAWADVQYKKIPAAVRAVLEVTGVGNE